MHLFVRERKILFCFFPPKVPPPSVASWTSRQEQFAEMPPILDWLYSQKRSTPDPKLYVHLFCPTLTNEVLRLRLCLFSIKSAGTSACMCWPRSAYIFKLGWVIEGVRMRMLPWRHSAALFIIQAASRSCSEVLGPAVVILLDSSEPRRTQRGSPRLQL